MIRSNTTASIAEIGVAETAVSPPRRSIQQRQRSLDLGGEGLALAFEPGETAGPQRHEQRRLAPVDAPAFERRAVIEAGVQVSRRQGFAVERAGGGGAARREAERALDRPRRPAAGGGTDDAVMDEVAIMVGETGPLAVGAG